MRNRVLVTAIISCFVLAFGVALAGETDVEIRHEPLQWKQARHESGEALYAELCAACHGADARGNGPATPALETPVPDLTVISREHEGYFPAERIEATITGDREVPAHEVDGMPMWGAAFREVRKDWTESQREHFARTKVLELVGYIESIQRPVEPLERPEDRPGS